MQPLLTIILLTLYTKIYHSPVEVLPERSTDPVQRYRIGARVKVAQAETDDPQVVPERVVCFLCVRIKIEEQHEHVSRKEANSKH